LTVIARVDKPARFIQHRLTLRPKVDLGVVRHALSVLHATNAELKRVISDVDSQGGRASLGKNALAPGAICADKAGAFGGNHQSRWHDGPVRGTAENITQLSDVGGRIDRDFLVAAGCVPPRSFVPGNEVSQSERPRRKFTPAVQLQPGAPNLIDVLGPLTHRQLIQNAEKMNIERWEVTAPTEPTFAWVLEAARRYEPPVAYTHRSGAVIWARLP